MAPPATRFWRGLTPYFTPGAAWSFKVTTTTATSYLDAGLIGDPALNYLTIATIATANNCPLGVSKWLGEFDLALVSGAAFDVAAVQVLDERSRVRRAHLSRLDLRALS